VWGDSPLLQPMTVADRAWITVQLLQCDRLFRQRSLPVILASGDIPAMQPVTFTRAAAAIRSAIVAIGATLSQLLSLVVSVKATGRFAASMG
jgi:hypothetical protein